MMEERFALEGDFDGSEGDGVEEDESEGEEANDGARASPAKRAKRGNERYALPTPEEASQLRSTEDLYRGNVMKLEAAELLAEVRVDYSSRQCRKFEAWLFRLRDALLALPAAAGVTEDALNFPGIRTPGRSFAPQSRAVSLDFVAPTSVDLIGSYMLHALTRPALCADLAVEIPEGCLHERDALNHRYFDKRALFLAQLAKHALGSVISEEVVSGTSANVKAALGKKRKHKANVGDNGAGKGNGLTASTLSELVKQVEVSYFNGDSRKPVLILHPRLEKKSEASGSGDASAGKTPSSEPGFVVRLLPVAPEGSFASEKLAPTRNNVRRRRPRVAAAQDGEAGAAGAAAWAGMPDTLLAEHGKRGGYSGRLGEAVNMEGEPCTPSYNSALLEDMAMKRQLAALHGMLAESDNLRDALLLGKVWLMQRGQRSAYDGLGSHGFAMLLLYLVQRKVVSPRMAPLQVLAALLSFVAGGGLTGSCLQVRTSAAGKALLPAGETVYRQSFPAVLFDTSDGLNVLHRVSAEALKELQADAAAAAAALGARSQDAVASLFLRRAGFWRKHDCFVRVPLAAAAGASSTSSAANGSALAANAKGAKADHSTTATASVAQSGAGMDDDEEEDAACDAPLWQFVARRACTLLRRGLGDRCHSLRPLCGVGTESPADFRGAAGSITWALSAPAPANGYAPGEWLCIGLVLDPMNATRLVDRGPPADDETAASAFRRFWGARSQLRRFKDGAIVEAVIWGNEGEEQQHSIVRTICLYVLALHDPERCAHSPKVLGEARSSNGSGSSRGASASGRTLGARFCGDEVLEAISAKSGKSKGKASTCESLGLQLPNGDDALTRACLRAFEEVAAAAKSVKGMPLRIDGVQAISPLLRYTAAVPPLPHPLCISPLAAKTRFRGLRGRGAVVLAPDAAIAPFWTQKGLRGAKVSSEVEAVDCLLQLESSNKWPDEIDAVRQTAAAMLIRLAQCLERDAGLHCTVTRTPAGVSALEVLAGGYCIRMRLSVNAELVALRAKAAEAGAPAATTATHATAAATTLGAGGGGEDEAAPSSEEARGKAAALAAASAPARQGAEARALQLLLEAAPRHHSAVHGLHLQHPAYGPTVRAASRWVAAHMLSWHIPHEALELIVASLYVTSAGAPTSLPPPATALSGLLRFLLLLGSHDWARSPLVVDVNGELTSEDRQTAQHVFETMRGTSSGGKLGVAGPAMYVVAPYDRAWGWCPSWTTEHRPEGVVMQRAMALASSSATQLIAWAMGGGGGRGGGDDSWNAVFAPSPAEISGFNSVLRVHPAMSLGLFELGGAASGAEAVLARVCGCPALRIKLYKNIVGGKQSGERDDGEPNLESAVQQVVVAFDPVAELVGQLRARFGHLALFFYSDWAPGLLAVVWRPAASVPTSFNVAHARHMAPADAASAARKGAKASPVVSNLEDVLSEIRCVAGDLLV